MIVDDDPRLLRVMSILLNSSGYDVDCVEGGEKALSRVSLIRPDVVVTDLRMEGMDGMSLFSAINEINPALPVIMLTGHGTIPEAVAATKQGIFSFLSKPVDGKILLEQIQKALQISGDSGVSKDTVDESEWRQEIVTRSPVMEELLQQAFLVAQGDVSVFISGASGTGKELIAKAIHKASPRCKQPFVAINCSAIPEPLLESELFGHRKGSFTGATKDHIGLIQAATGGTLFLDEIGDMPLVLQAKLLRALQEQTVRPVGSTESVSVDIRVISATHKDIDQEMTDGTFREDLYYRLNVVSLDVPPLHKRREDIPLLTGYFLQESGKKDNKKFKVSPEAMELLVSASWPGNVRQLLNVVEQVVALSPTSIIPPSLIKRALRNPGIEILPYDEAKRRFEREYLSQLLQITGGKVSQAARLAKRNRTNFYKLLQRHTIEPELFNPASNANGLSDS